MKKNLACVLALAVIPAVHAQSLSRGSVQLYGAVDVAVAHYRTSGMSKTAMHPGGAGSRLGFLSIEDLGNGLRVGARLEAGFNVDTGVVGSGGRFFSRQAYLEVAHDSWGAIRLGRQEGPTYTFFPKFDPMLIPAMDAWGVLTTLGSPAPGRSSGRGVSSGFLINPTQRTDNTLAYISPKLHGFQGKVSYSLREDSPTIPKLLEASLEYERGPLTLGALFVKTSSTPGDGTVGPTAGTKEYALGASYKAGPVQPYFSYIHRDKTDDMIGPAGLVLNGNSESVVLLGAVIPVSARGDIRMTVGKYSSGTSESDALSYGVAYTYALSKTVGLMAAVTRLTQDRNSQWPIFQSPVPNPGKAVNGVIVGMTKRF